MDDKTVGARVNERWWRHLTPWQDAALVSLSTFLLSWAGMIIGWIPRLESTWAGDLGQLAIYAGTGFFTRLLWLVYRRRQKRRTSASGPVTALPRTARRG